MHRVLLVVVAALLLLLPPVMDLSSMLGAPYPLEGTQEGITLQQVLSAAPPFLAGLMLTLAHYLKPTSGIFALGVGVQLAALARLLCLFTLLNVDQSIGAGFVYLLLSLILLGLAALSLTSAFGRTSRHAAPDDTPTHQRAA